MKKIIFTLIICIFAFSIYAQTTKPPTGPPKTPPSPPVAKKDFDAAMADLNDRIATLSRQINVVSGRVNNKDNNLDALQSNIDTLNKILQSMNIKVSLTSDSLSITSFTINDLRKKVDDDIAAIDTKIVSAKQMIFLSYIGIGIVLILLFICFFMLYRKLKSLSNIESSIAEFMEDVQKDFDKMKAEIKPTITKEVQASQTILDSRISRTKVELIDMITLVKHQMTKLIAEINTKPSEAADK